MFPGFLLAIIGISAAILAPIVALALLGALAIVRFRAFAGRTLLFACFSGLVALVVVVALSFFFGAPSGIAVYPAAFAACFTLGAICCTFLAVLRHLRGSANA